MWVVTSSLEESADSSRFKVIDGGGSFLRNVGNRPRDYTVLNPDHNLNFRRRE
jgi:hypothetical protein